MLVWRWNLFWLFSFCGWSRYLFFNLQLRLSFWIFWFLSCTFHRIKTKESVLVFFLFVIFYSFAVKNFKTNKMECVTKKHCLYLFVIWTWAWKRWCDVYFKKPGSQSSINKNIKTVDFKALRPVFCRSHGSSNLWFNCH